MEVVANNAGHNKLNSSAKEDQTSTRQISNLSVVVKMYILFEEICRDSQQLKQNIYSIMLYPTGKLTLNK